MKKNKDFTYYGKKRVKVLRFMEILKSEKFNVFSILIPYTLCALIFDIEDNFSFSLSRTGGVLATIFFCYLSYYIFSIIAYFVCRYLAKYYWSKRVELFNKYLEEKDVDNK